MQAIDAMFISAYNDPHVIAGQATDARRNGRGNQWSVGNRGRATGSGEASWQELPAGFELSNAGREIRVVGVEAAASPAISAAVSGRARGAGHRRGNHRRWHRGQHRAWLRHRRDASPDARRDLVSVTEDEIRDAIRFLAATGPRGGGSGGSRNCRGPGREGAGPGKWGVWWRSCPDGTSRCRCSPRS